MLLPHDRATYEPGVLACGALAYGVAVAALLLFDRIPLAVSQMMPAVGTLLISAAAVFEGSGMSVYPVVYAWVAVAAAQLLSRRWAVAHVALVGGGLRGRPARDRGAECRRPVDRGAGHGGHGRRGGPRPAPAPRGARRPPRRGRAHGPPHGSAEPSRVRRRARARDRAGTALAAPRSASSSATSTRSRR
ncbi:MAG: hypothetical protein WKF31_12250 [Thermoleophilaceae bacterium]